MRGKLRALSGVGGVVSVVVGGFTILYTLLFSAVLLKGELLAPADGFNFYLPAFHAEAPLWEPDLLSGTPSVGDAQEMAWYLPARLFRLLPGGWNAYVISAYVLFSTTSFWFVRTLTGSTAAGVVSGLVAGLSGFSIFHLRAIAMVHTAGWLPLVLTCIYQAANRRSRSDVALGAVAIACMVFAGHPQFLAYALCVALAFAIVSVYCASVGRAACLRGVALQFAFGFSLSAMVLLPLFSLARQSVRSALSYETFTQFALPLQQLPQLLFPYVFGDPTSYIGAPNLAELSGYVGLLPLLFAGAAFAVSPLRMETLFFSGVAAVSLLLVVGDATPVSRLAFALPGLNQLRVPTRHFFEFTIAISALCGFGFAALAAASEERRRAVVNLLLAGGVIVFGVTLLWILVDDELPIPVDGGATDAISRFSLASVTVPLLLFSLGAVCLSVWNGLPGWRTHALVIAIGIDLIVFASLAEWRFDSRHADELAMPSSLSSVQQALAASKQRMTPVLGTESAIDSAPPNRSRLWGLPSTTGFNPLRLERYAEFLGVELWGQVSPQVLRDENLALDLLASRFVAVPREKIAEDLGRSPRWRLVHRLETSDIYENLRALPRAWLVDRVVSLSRADVLRSVYTSRLPDGGVFDPRDTALVEGEQLNTIPARISSGTKTTRGAHVETPDSVTVRVSTDHPEPSTLVLSDIHYPGWRAESGGAELEILRCNYVLRCVSLEAGPHEIVFHFEPVPYRVGWVLAWSSAVLLTGYGAGLPRSRS